MHTCTRRYAVLAAGLVTGAALLLPVVPAAAATAGHLAPHRAAAARTTPRLSPAALARVRARQRQTLAAHTTAPAFAKADATTYTVDTPDDTSLAVPTDTHCLDAAGKCSLRAAVEAADNLAQPVEIVLGSQTYPLSSGAALTISDPAGISVVGAGQDQTTVSGGGAGIFVLPWATPGEAPPGLFLSALTLTNGSSPDGGAVDIQDGSGATLVLDQVTATRNTASAQGGAIYAPSQASVYVRHSRFTHNSAGIGGAISQFWANLQVAGTSFTANSTTSADVGYGGAISSVFGVLDVTGGSISGNTAGDPASHDGQGGAIYDESTATTLTDVQVDGNTAVGDRSGGAGGAIYSNEDELTINGGTMSHNQATGASGEGGAIYVQDQTQLAAHGVAMVGNRAEGDTEGSGGGTVYALADDYPVQIVIDGGSVIRHSDNSAVYVYGSTGGADVTISQSLLAGNTGSANGRAGQGCGGAVCAYQSSQGGLHLQLTGNRVVRNSSVGLGGSGAVTAYADSDASVSLLLRRNLFSANSAGAGGYGGAVGTETTGENSPISLRMRANTFSGNRAGTTDAAGFGGALAIESYTAVSDHGSTFTHNQALGDGASGGAIYDASGNSSGFVHTRMVDNSAGTDAASNAGYGGAIYSSDYSGTVFDGVTMSDNHAASQGGGLYGDGHDSQIAVGRSTISGNTAGTDVQSGAGGGIYTGWAVLAVENSTLTGNQATSSPDQLGEGGGIWYSGGRVELRYSTVSRNVGQDGAGIYADTFSTVLGSILSDNRATPGGPERDCGAGLPAYGLRSLGGNVLGGASCAITVASTDAVSTHPHLGRLADHGGPTPTMAIGKRSPAAGRANFLVPLTDQRGWKRPRSHADAGAFQRPRPRRQG